MKKIIGLIIIFLCPFPLYSEEKGILTLEEAFQKALRRSESVAIQEESIRVAEAHYLRALGTILPRINAKGTELLQDTANTAGGEGSVGTTFTRRSRPEVALTVHQPLFQGLREFKALGISKSERQKNSLQRDRAEQLLFSDVALAYYSILELEKEEKILDSIHETLQQRRSELVERVHLGKSREGEILTVEAETSSLQGDIERLRGQIQGAREMLAFLVGEEASQRLADRFQVPPIKPIQNYLQSLEARPDLLASEKEVKLARGEYEFQKGGRYPSLSMDANYYPYRVGFLKDINWDVLFTLNIPLFQGGATRGLIHEAKANLRQTELKSYEAHRMAERDIRQAHASVIASQKRENALRLAESKNAANYKTDLEDYRLGLINHLDVLQGLRNWQSSRIDANRAYFQTKLDYLKLLLSSGEIPGGTKP